MSKSTLFIIATCVVVTIFVVLGILLFLVINIRMKQDTMQQGVTIQINQEGSSDSDNEIDQAVIQELLTNEQTHYLILCITKERSIWDILNWLLEEWEYHFNYGYKPPKGPTMRHMLVVNIETGFPDLLDIGKEMYQILRSKGIPDHTPLWYTDFYDNENVFWIAKMSVRGSYLSNDDNYKKYKFFLKEPYSKIDNLQAVNKNTLLQYYLEYHKRTIDTEIKKRKEKETWRSY